MESSLPQAETIHLVGFAEIGAYLRAARESLGVPLEQPARDLHLRVPYLQAVESGQPEGMPGMAYARGYTKKYAEYLGVDTAIIMRAFDQAVHFRDPVLPPAPTRHEARPHRMLLLLCAVVLLLLMGAWRMLWPLDRAAPEKMTATSASIQLPAGSARACWLHLPVDWAGPACYSQASTKPLRPTPTERYGTELRLPAEGTR